MSKIKVRVTWTEWEEMTEVVELDEKEFAELEPDELLSLALELDPQSTGHGGVDFDGEILCSKID